MSTTQTEERYFSAMMPSLANRAGLGTVSWLGFANVPLQPATSLKAFLLQQDLDVTAQFRAIRFRKTPVNGQVLQHGRPDFGKRPGTNPLTSSISKPGEHPGVYSLLRRRSFLVRDGLNS